MRNAVLICLLCFCGFYSYAQKIVLKKSPVLHYDATQEQQAFEKLTPATFDSQFMLLYASSPGANFSKQSTYAQQLKEFINALSPAVDKAKGPEKKIKAIHKAVHQAYLKKYVMANHFADIFSTGEYNCVSATALFGLILQQLDIPFSIKETPTHVFLVAYPESSRIVLESTDPQSGYIAFNARFKNEYVSQLRKMKLISEREYQTKGVEKLFDEMYFSNQDISLKELIALQYYNDGLYLMDEEKYDSSLQQFDKAYTLYPSDRGGFLIYNTLLLAKEKKTYADSAYINYLLKLANIEGIDNHREHLKSEFALFTQDQLSNKGQVEYYDKMFHKLAANLSDTVLTKDISYTYYFEKGRTAYSGGQFTEALKWSEKAYKLMPDATNSTGLFLSCLSQRLNTIYSLDEKTTLLEGYIKNYPGLENNNLIYSQLLQFYLAQFGQAYELEQDKKGSQYRQNFEKAYLLKKGGTEGYILDNMLLGRAYSLAAVYYFRRGQTAQARQIINKGLEFDPNNYELLQRKQMIR